VRGTDRWSQNKASSPAHCPPSSQPKRPSNQLPSPTIRASIFLSSPIALEGTNGTDRPATMPMVYSTFCQKSR
jgi:hypothetical protein